MTYFNRGRLAVVIGGNWRLYTRRPDGWEMIVTVQLGMEIGALGKSPIGLYAQINAGAIHSLPQNKVIAALASATLLQPK